MRIQQLDLKRYGKFTDRRLEFPPAARDFHFLVGANEAGKSTTRSAILDLLFGIATRSSYDFVHAKAELRLGACVEQGGTLLRFERSKARTKSLFDERGQVLPETALAAFLGVAERDFFDQMFGLDHGRLEAGGNAILSASNDLGQILFQSAAGIGSLKAVREQLDAEADKLWAKRRAGDRAYYAASDELAAADAALKAATVRTKEWLDARAKVAELEQARAQLRARLDGLELQRSRLERVRRVAPALRQLQAAQAELDALQSVALLPADAARVLAEVELELASAARTRELFTAQAQGAAERLATLKVDAGLLGQRVEILALEQRRQQVRGHGREIDGCRAELAGHWQRIMAELHALGWPSLDEPALAARLPSLPARLAFAGLAKRHALLDQACRNAAAAEAEKAAELDGLAQPDQAPINLPISLRLALEQARALGDTRAAARRTDAARARSERELRNASAGLGVWRGDLPALRALSLPSEAALQQRLQAQLELQNKARSLAERRAELAASVAALALEITQYTQAHRPVGAAELAQARAGRDAQWQRIKQGEDGLPMAAAGFEASIAQADGLADQRHAKAREASELQARQDALQRLRQQATELDSAQAGLGDELAAAAADWQALSERLGLAGLAALDFEVWRTARLQTLAAQEGLDAALAEQQAGATGVAEARASLAAALRAAQIGFDDAGDALETLMALASAALDQAGAARARAEALARQLEQGRSAARQLRERHAAAQAELAQWRLAWAQALQALGQPADLSAEAADAVCQALAAIDAGLKQTRELRLGRIATMARELADFEQELAGCAQALGLSLSGPADASAQQLMANLDAALAAQQEAQRLRQELQGFEDRAAAAGQRLDEALARLQPLLNSAGVAGTEALRASIAGSDQRRAALAAQQAAQAALADGGDGLDPAALAAEVAATDAAQIPLAVAELARQITDAQQQSESASAELGLAAKALAAIAGRDDAAQAEGQRQDALAKMSNAAERYVKVYTASRLLKWAIDRYRETKQGPMLGRAGEIFAALTLGSFQRLSVDFEAQPPTLAGLRADGRLVGVAGMSEGTRDQLFMALRLAALELHIAQDPVHALPFVADDLFINYDDGRAEAGLAALAELSERTQVIFLSHHAHLLPLVQTVFGAAVNVIRL